MSSHSSALSSFHLLDSHISVISKCNFILRLIIWQVEHPFCLKLSNCMFSIMVEGGMPQPGQEQICGHPWCVTSCPPSWRRSGRSRCKEWPVSRAWWLSAGLPRIGTWSIHTWMPCPDSHCHCQGQGSQLGRISQLRGVDIKMEEPEPKSWKLRFIISILTSTVKFLWAAQTGYWGTL